MNDKRSVSARALVPLFVGFLVTAVPAASRGQATGEPVPPPGTIIVSNMDGLSVSLIDARSGRLRGTVTAEAAPHEVAVSSDGAVAVVTNYGAPGAGNLLQFIDVGDAKLTRTVTVEGFERLHGAAFLPGDSLLVLTSERTQQIVVVSAADGTVRRTLPTEGGAPHMLALGGRWVWAANITGGSLSRIDPSGRTETEVWPAGTRTEGVATTPDGTEGWTGSMDAGTVVGIDAATGETVARVTGLGVPYRLAVTSDARTVVVSDPGRERLVLIDRAAGAVSAEVDFAAASAAEGLGGEPSPQGFTLTPDGTWALVSAKGIDRVGLVHIPTARLVRFYPTGAGPDGIAFSPVAVEPRPE